MSNAAMSGLRVPVAAQDARTENKRSEVTELRTLLRSLEVQRDPKSYLQVVQKVIAYMTLGIDVSKLFSEMIMASATQDLVQKKLVYLYLTTYAKSNPEVAILTVNTLQKDCRDRNPVIRGLALRSMCSLRIPNIVEYLRDPLQAGLVDRSAYVRKTAVMGVVKVFYVAPQVISDLNLVDILYQMLRDKDVQVVSNCISALNEILAAEGGMVMNAKIAHYLLNRLHEFTEWGQGQVMEQVLRYQPASDEEAIDILNILDDRLKHANFGVVMATVRVFLHVTSNMLDMQADILERIRAPLLTFLGSSSPEVIYTCLQHIQLVMAKQSDLWSKDYSTFFCRYNDPPYVKSKKLELLTELCSMDNAFQIVEELGGYATDVNVSVAQKAVQAICNIALRLTGRADLCVDKLLSLFAMETDYVTAEALVAMTNILRQFENMVEVILPRLPASLDSVPDPSGKAALIWILGEYGESLPNAPYVLEEAIDNITDESSAAVKLQLLTATMKLFFKRPPECQAMLGRLLEHAIDEEGDMDVHDRGMLYYRLLKHDVEEARRVVCGEAKTVMQENTVIPRMSLFSEFNTLAIMYGRPCTEFILQECPYTLGTGGKRGGAESSFDATPPAPTVAKPPEGQPAHSGLTTVYAHRFYENGVMENLPIDAERPRYGNPPSILLNPKPSLPAPEFEKMWMAMNKTHDVQVQLESVPHPRDMETALASRFVFTLASSPPDQPMLKSFLYSQNVSTLHWFLAEVTIMAASRELTLNLKCENTNQGESFLKHFLEVLLGNNWLA